MPIVYGSHVDRPIAPPTAHPVPQKCLMTSCPLAPPVGLGGCETPLGIGKPTPARVEDGDVEQLGRAGGGRGPRNSHKWLAHCNGDRRRDERRLTHRTAASGHVHTYRAGHQPHRLLPRPPELD